ncbi:hypothetical protein K2Y11_09475 [bacterium]|jgi:hypothetical protein|nr:hypothetical protein [bacterium]
MAEDKQWYDDVDTKMVFWTGFFTLLIVIVLVLGVQAAYFSYNKAEAQKKEREPVVSNEILAKQAADLDGYKKYKVGDSTRIAIPINRAMELVAEETAK